MFRIWFTLTLVTLFLTGCDRDGSSNQSSKYGYDTSRVGYGYGDGSYGNGGVPSSGGGNLFSGDTVTGSGGDGQLSTGEMQDLQETLSKLSPEQRQQVAYYINLNLNQCSFPPAGEAAASACQAGRIRGCSDLLGGYSAGFLRLMLQKMGLFPSSDDVRSEMSGCGSVNLSNPTQVQNFIKLKKDMCAKGNRRACVGLLLFLTRLFLRGLMLALSLISA